MHGGPDQAVCLYATEAIARVAADGDRAFPGAYGENLTVEGIDWGSLRAGDTLVIGEDGLTLELTKPAAPCQTIAHWFVERRIARISPNLHPEDSRWYARVLVEGRVRPGDRVEVERVEVERAEAERAEVERVEVEGAEPASTDTGSAAAN